MLAVTDVERLIVRRSEDDVYDLPVTLMGLPDEVAGHLGVAVEVVVVEVPVLEHDAGVEPGDTAVDDLRRSVGAPGRDVAAQPADADVRHARALVQSPARSGGR
jgi:hypothetical protein